jgi:hypothetical protein
MTALFKNARFTLEHLEGQLILCIVNGLHGANLPVKQTCEEWSVDTRVLHDRVVSLIFVQ